jgi:hypothetical protein
VAEDVTTEVTSLEDAFLALTEEATADGDQEVNRP